MPATPSAEPLPTALSTALAEFARACKSAARSVSLYPGTHPSIVAALGRVTAAGERLTAGADAALGVHPDALILDGRVAARPDAAIGELAALLHERLIGELRISDGTRAEDWHALLTLLARTPDDILHDGGIAKAWAATGRTNLEIRAIDYAEVLRERAGGDEAVWDRIIAFCLEGESTSLDDRALAALLETVHDPQRFGELLERLQRSPAPAGAGMGATAAALLQLLRTAVEHAVGQGDERDAVLASMATSTARLTPEMLLALLTTSRSGTGEDAAMASAVLDRMTDDTIASFVANSVAADRGATERLAHAFEALVPEAERKAHLLELAEPKVRQTELGQEAAFDNLWQTAADMLTSYSDRKFVSDEYGRELSSARTRAIDVERVADDPPERVEAWLQTISDAALRDLDRCLLIDLLTLEHDPAQWEPLAAVAAGEVERRTLLGDIDAAADLAAAILGEPQTGARAGLAAAAAALGETIASGPLVRHVVLHLRKGDDRGIAAAARLCHTLGRPAVPPLAEALAAEDNSRAIRALREILLDFGAVGRSSVEQLKNSQNPAVRRTAIDLLRVFGGNEALPELASMLGDADPQVQRESIRAIVQIGTEQAYAVLQHALVGGSGARETIIQQLIALRDDKAVPLLCHILTDTPPRGALAASHLQIIDALAALHPREESTRALRFVLYRDIWWAPFRTTALREAAAGALARIGTPEAHAVLDEARRAGSRRVRKIARATAAAARRRDQERA